MLLLTSVAVVIAGCQQSSIGSVIDDQQTSIQETISIYELGRLLGLRMSESKSTHITLKNSANTVMIFMLSGGQVYVNA